MKYILFLFCILFFNSSLWAEDSGTASGSGITVNLGNYKSNFMKSSTDFGTNLDSIDNFSLNTSSMYSYGSSSSTLRFGQPTCSYETPQACQLFTSCISVGGYWNAIDNNCGRADCHFGTTPDLADPLKCKCNDDPYAYVQRGNYLQSCPSQCFSQPNKYYSLMKKSCECNDGYTMATNGTCIQNAAPVAQPAQEVDDCWRELAEKTETCEASANEAVSKCEFAPENDSLKALQGLLLSGKGSAGENCERAATASTSGFYQTEDNLKSCDEGINSCKTTCVDVKTYLNANKERLYNACRERALQAQTNAGPPLPADRFNPMWDSENKSNLESQFQGLITRIDNSNTTCESGTAVKNREKLTASMNDMNTSAKNAATCACQLSSGSGDCSSTPGPADCSSNPSALGCTKVADNCFDAKNISLKCICFRNPDSLACMDGKAKLDIKNAASDASGFAGGKAVTDTRAGNNSAISGMAAGKNSETVTTGINNAGEKYKINVNDDLGVAAPPAASGTTVSSEGNRAAPVAGGASLGGGNLSTGIKPSPQDSKTDASIATKIGGFFNTAKSALGGVFKKGSGERDSSGGNFRDGGRVGHGFDPRKLRPRAIVRGIASEEGFAGKHEDIWKVMNKQYKIQDQKDKFIFDSEKN